jgi:hypothetical protein
MRVRSGLYRSPHFSNDQSTPHSAALHTGLRSGHTSGVQDFNLFPSWMTLQRLGSGDGEREAPMTRQMPFEPLPASVLLGVAVFGIGDCIAPLFAALDDKPLYRTRSGGNRKTIGDKASSG